MSSVNRENNLREAIQCISEKWSLSKHQVIKDNKDIYVARALNHLNQSVVIKIHTNKKYYLHEHAGLTYFQGAECIKLLDSDHAFNALLLEYATPGTSLISKNMEEQLECYCQIVKALASKPIIQHDLLMSVSDRLQIIDAAKNMPSIERRYYERACELREKLLNTPSKQYVCHGDLHFENIINHQKHWIIIDPNWVIADMEFEVAACDLLTSDNAVAGRSQILERAEQLSRMLNLNLERLLAWYFLRKLIIKMGMSLVSSQSVSHEY